ncbi:MAG: MgtC/SapB family protein [Elusimicrobiota bacterium]|jgi:putative Mg2+ transporter-C (MgtC) family protein|nr:MgtC/SapB family protein [Elusimicrobiota bacterium]
MILFNDILLRILVSFLLGCLIGLERQYHDKPAGFATNTLICLGATVLTMLSINSAAWFGGDAARIAAQIVAGVGFLGAGSILRDGNKISGLTTAAGIWLVAAVGMAVGYGAFDIAFVATAAALLLQLVRRKLMTSFDHVKVYDSITIKCDPKWTVVETINATISKYGGEILKQEVHKDGGLFVIKMITNMSEKTFKTIFRELVILDEIKALDK